MKKIKAIIVEDEPKSAKTLHNLLQDYVEDVAVIATAGTVSSAVEAIREYAPGLVFLDVEMPDGSGFEVLEQTGGYCYHAIITTAFDHYAIPAIRHSALDYLLKPIDVDELKNATERVRNKTVAKGGGAATSSTALNRLVLPTFDGLLFVDIAQVVRCKSEGSYTRFYLNDRSEILVSRNIKAYEESLPADLFCRVHNMHIVNLTYIKKYVRGRGGYLLLKDDSAIEVSIRKKEEFLQRFL
jgi:two-component system, LytTR family, response regulator